MTFSFQLKNINEIKKDKQNKYAVNYMQLIAYLQFK